MPITMRIPVREGAQAEARDSEHAGAVFPAASARFTACVLAGAAAYLYANLFVSGDVPVLLGGDQVYFWLYAQRMLNGERQYLDFFQFTPPGTDLFYLTLFKIFGSHIWVTNLAVLALGVALCWVCLRISAALMRRSLAVLATGVFLVVVYGKLLNGTHHWFSVFLALLAVSIAMRGRGLARMAIAGALLGLASFFTQTCGAMALVAFCVWIVWEEWPEPSRWTELARKLAALVLGFCGTLGAVYVHWIATVGVKRLWYFQVTYVAQYMVRWYGGALPEALTWRRLPAVVPTLLIDALLPVIYPVALVLLWRRWRAGGRPGAASRVESAARLVALVGLAWLGEVGVSPTWLRVYTVAMPGVILLFWMIGRSERWRVRLAALACLAVAGMAVHQMRARRTGSLLTMSLPAGRAATTADPAEEFGWLMSHTQPGQYAFEVRGIEIYFPLQLRNPAFADDIEEPDYVERAMRELNEKQVRYVLWPASLNRTGLDPLWTAHLPELRSHLQDGYAQVHAFSDGDEIWERK